MTHEIMMSLNNTAQNKNAPSKLNFSVNYHQPAVPSSVKHSSKPSTAASSMMKNQINQAIQSLKFKNDSLKHHYKSKLSQNKPNLTQYVSSSIVKYSTNYSKGSENKPKFEHEGSGINQSDAKNSSIYESRRSKNIADLNKSVGHSSKHKSKIDASQSSNSKHENSGMLKILINKDNDSKILELKPGYNPTNGFQFGLDDKYLESSLDKEDPIHGASNQWTKEQHEEFENLTSESMTSLGSVPDEYTVFENENHDKNPKREMKAEIKHNSKHTSGITDKTSLKPKPDEINDEDFESDIGNENTQSTGVEVRYSLNIPSMISHLKRKDNYLESLDSFLNENLKAIADLIKIKKQVKTDMDSYQAESKYEKENIKILETEGKKLESDIARTLEENY